ncbi:MAG TPA: beta-ketoacyl-ACP synthase III [Armatimonadota bacterium]|nr:beta-ketoacyl-ACP synthase III [Armatimonadota bacterium]
MDTLVSVGITGVGGYAPPGVLTNHDLEQMVETSDEWIRTRSGISNRHIADAATATSDIALPAARQALERAGLAPDALDIVVMATFTPDYLLPATACTIQHALGATRAAAFDLAAACSGFIYAINVIAPSIATGQFRNALVIGADTLSKVTDYTDRSTCVLFGDGAGAAVLQPVPAGRGLLASYLRADGGGCEMLYIPGGMTRKPASHETVDARDHYVKMSGNEVFRFAVRALEEAVLEALSRAGLTAADVDLIVPHQANIRIIDGAAKRLGIPEDRWVINLHEYGNTSGGSIPLALNDAYEQGRLHEGDVVVFVAFGGGLTWGASVLRW